MICVGTSGFAFASWQGVFYPVGLPKARRLEFYCRHFNCLELNSTYYHPAGRATMGSLASRTPEGFRVAVKLHQSFVRPGMTPSFTPGEFMAALQPLRDAGKLAAVLAQFPQAFRNREGNRRHVLRLAEECGDAPIVAEFRHESWHRPAVFDWLREAGVACCSVDEPSGLGLMPSSAIVTASPAYVRLHGRNASGWHSGGKDRYDYLYSEEELSVWADRIRWMSEMANEVFFFANNCYTGKAVINAKMFQKLLSLPVDGSAP